MLGLIVAAAILLVGFGLGYGTREFISRRRRRRIRSTINDMRV